MLLLLGETSRSRSMEAQEGARGAAGNLGRHACSSFQGLEQTAPQTNVGGGEKREKKSSWDGVENHS